MTLPAITIATSSARALATNGAMRGIWKMLTNKWIGRGAIGYSVYDLWDSDSDWDTDIDKEMPYATDDQKDIAKGLISGTLEDISQGNILNFETNLKKIQDGSENQLFIVQQVYPANADNDTYSLNYRPFSKSSVYKTGFRKNRKR